jgi:hypothetical protein
LVFGEEESWFAVDTLVLSPVCQKVLKHALVFELLQQQEKKWQKQLMPTLYSAEEQ